MNETITEHELEIERNNALISDLTDTVKSMERSIRILTIENSGHTAKIGMINRQTKG